MRFLHRHDKNKAGNLIPVPLRRAPSPISQFNNMNGTDQISFNFNYFLIYEVDTSFKI